MPLSYLSSQALMATAMYFGTFFSFYLPIRYFKTPSSLDVPYSKRLDFEQEQKNEQILSNCNCLATGIFISMCFVSLMPLVNEEFNRFFVEANLQNINYPVGEFVMLLGFFMVLFLENYIMKVRADNKTVLHLDDHLSEEQNYKLLSSIGAQSTSEISRNFESPNLLEVRFENAFEQHNHQEQSEANENHEQHHFFDDQEQQNHSHQHEHHHHHFDLNELSTDSIGVGFFMLMFASSIHSVFEGLALGLIKDSVKAFHLFVGILLHECIVSVALGIQACKMNKGVAFGLAFSATIPLGMVLGVAIGYTPGLVGIFISAVCQGLAAGTFIHVTFYELLPSELTHGQSPHMQSKKIALIFIGFLLMALLAFYCD